MPKNQSYIKPVFAKPVVENENDRRGRKSTAEAKMFQRQQSEIKLKIKTLKSQSNWVREKIKQQEDHEKMEQRHKMFAGFESEAAAIEKLEANQLQVIKKADIFGEGKYKKMANEQIKDGDEHFVDLNEVEKPVTVEEYKRERQLLEQEK